MTARRADTAAEARDLWQSGHTLGSDDERLVQFATDRPVGTTLASNS